mmetsp:Transcript_23156/g.34295  ORF Transcript_23156/g.34295 Transcript_23156/m.34295 type:complete len:85 (-) Transcript_23156:147-401(-)
MLQTLQARTRHTLMMMDTSDESVVLHPSPAVSSASLALSNIGIPGTTTCCGRTKRNNKNETKTTPSNTHHEHHLDQEPAPEDAP